MITALLVSVAGGLGAALRFALDSLAQRRVRSGWPLGTALVNLSGSFLLGLLAGLATEIGSSRWPVVLGVGFLGGYTTFSTASLETVRLLQDRRWRAGMAYGLGGLIGGVAAAGLGWQLGRLA